MGADAFYALTMVPPDSTVHEAMRRRKLLDKLQTTRYSQLKTATLARLVDVLNNEHDPPV